MWLPLRLNNTLWTLLSWVCGPYSPCVLDPFGSYNSFYPCSSRLPSPSCPTPRGETQWRSPTWTLPALGLPEGPCICSLQRLEKGFLIMNGQNTNRNLFTDLFFSTLGLRAIQPELSLEILVIPSSVRHGLQKGWILTEVSSLENGPCREWMVAANCNPAT